jgi:hypothetical protein
MNMQKTNPGTQTSLAHPSHKVPEEIAQSIRKIHEVEEAARRRSHEIAKLARPTREERRVIADVRRLTSEGRGDTSDLFEKLRDINKRKNNLVKDALNRDVAIKSPFERHVFDSSPAQPLFTDPTFWWARTNWWWTSERTATQNTADFGAFMDDAGLRFSGHVETDDGDLHFNNFGASALFEIQPERLPMSLSGRWTSSPYIELFGKLRAHTDWYVFEDAWSKCWLHLEQRLFQWGFGPNGPAPIILGEQHEDITLIFEEDENRFVDVPLPGFKFMPPVTITNLNRASSLWAELVIRFDIQTEGAGSNFWISDLLLRTFQWPLVAI